MIAQSVGTPTRGVIQVARSRSRIVQWIVIAAIVIGIVVVAIVYGTGGGGEGGY